MAVREVWPDTLEQRRTVHALRNVTSKLPERHHQEIKTRWWKIFDEARSSEERLRKPSSVSRRYSTRSTSTDSGRSNRMVRISLHTGIA
jgi:transposase-like protein